MKMNYKLNQNKSEHIKMDRHVETKRIKTDEKSESIFKNQYTNGLAQFKMD